VAGNIGPTLLDTLARHLDAAKTLPEVWVLELSSFQLDGVDGFEPAAATVLNVTQDHLDWHGSMEAYTAAKSRVFGSQGVMVLNREDPVVMAMLPAPVRGKGGRVTHRRMSRLAQTCRDGLATTALKKSTGWRGWSAPRKPTKRCAGGAMTQKNCTYSG
jgi:UDP-N-acetylmuramoylalanine-D-glutamate ligase